MGRRWGQIAKLSGVTFFRLSPFEQRPFAGMIKDGIPNTIRRINESILLVAPCFILAYVIQTWATHTNHQLHRKNPADFANDK
ncbi:ubiquinol-cytochrome c reductase ubiquinone-binding protein [Halictus rubicundus]|uniref:ubiquinol-cytochrome c reductase ubiquinone-binding protein n=1 Tax=Halictus rubicundus TaxID=77578 RepID=UPI00403702BF